MPSKKWKKTADGDEKNESTDLQDSFFVADTSNPATK